MTPPQSASGLKLARGSRVNDGGLSALRTVAIRAVRFVRDDFAVGHGDLLVIGADALAFDCHLLAGGDGDGQAVEPTLGVNRGHAARACRRDGLTIKTVLRVAAGEDAG